MRTPTNPNAALLVGEVMATAAFSGTLTRVGWNPSNLLTAETLRMAADLVQQTGVKILFVCTNEHITVDRVNGMVQGFSSEVQVTIISPHSEDLVSGMKNIETSHSEDPSLLGEALKRLKIGITAGIL